MPEAAQKLAIGVCFVSPKAYPLFNPDVEDVFGGAEVDLYYIGTELAKDAGFDVSFVTADYGQPDSELRENVRIIKSLTLDECALTGAAKIWRAMRKANAEIYVTKTASSGVPLIALFCRLKRRAFIYRTAHSIECDGTYLKKNRLMGRLFRLSLKQASLVFVQNQQDKTNLKKTTGTDSIVVHNGHRVKSVEQAERNIILWVGRSAQFKRLWMFIKLAKETPEEHFVMICQPAIGNDRYKELAAGAESVENLELIERVPFDKIDEHFRRAKVFVNTSDAEGFPNTFIQACQAGTPILSLNVNPDGFLDKYKCGICAKDDWKDFVHCLSELLDPDIGHQYGKNAIEYVKENHDITKIVSEYKSFFRTLSQNKRGQHD